MLGRLRKIGSNQKGLSLIEVLAAMVVLTLGILGLAPLMAISVRGSVHSENITSVVAAAQEMIEQKIGAVGFPTMPYVQTSTFDGGKYTVTTRITDNTVTSSIPAHVFKVDATVNWTDASGLARTLTFTTYTTKN